MPKFLVVDDEPMIAETLADFFAEEGIDVAHATTGADALSMFEGSPDFDALITDIDMPDMSGLVLVRRCRSIRPELPVVIITGHSSTAFMEPAWPCVVLEKPFHPGQLATAASKLVAQTAA